MFNCIRKITVHPLFFFCLAWIVLTDSSVSLLCVMTSVFVHECGHIFVYRYANVVINEIHLQPFGVRITVRNEAFISPRTQFWCAFAGPCMNFVCVCICLLIGRFTVLPEWIMIFYLSNLFLGIFNLLPIIPLDGSRMLHVILSALLGEYMAQILCAWISLLVGIGVLVCGIYVVIDSGINISLCVLAGYILICLAVKIYYYLKKRISNVKPKT